MSSPRPSGFHLNRFRLKLRPKLRATAFIVLGAVACMVFMPAAALAADAPLGFTVGIPGKTGCLVCHGDPKLTESKTTVSLYIKDTEIMSSVHKNVACVKCHTDFISVNPSASHQALATDSKKVAGLSCKNCHQHAPQLKVYDKSVHGRLALGGDPKAATCADCHGSHNIKSLKKGTTTLADFQMAGYEVCGKCHQKYYDSYSDYYHGAAYKTGATDAPACWDCHGAHDITAAAKADSKVNPVNLPKTCGTCHADNSKGLAKYAALIHGRQTVLSNNLIIKYKDKIFGWVGETFLGKTPAPAKAKAAETNPTAASQR